MLREASGNEQNSFGASNIIHMAGLLVYNGEVGRSAVGKWYHGGRMWGELMSQLKTNNIDK